MGKEVLKGWDTFDFSTDEKKRARNLINVLKNADVKCKINKKEQDMAKISLNMVNNNNSKKNFLTGAYNAILFLKSVLSGIMEYKSTLGDGINQIIDFLIEAYDLESISNSSSYRLKCLIPNISENELEELGLESAIKSYWKEKVSVSKDEKVDTEKQSAVVFYKNPLYKLAHKNNK